MIRPSRVAVMLLLFAAAAHAEPATLETPTGSIRGTLLLPDGNGPFPVAVIIAGSGPVDRDGNARQVGLHTNCLKQLAEALAEQGIATLRYDKRGVAASEAAGPDETDLRFEHYADDAARWCKQLAADSRFDRVILIGHSEGALLALLAAQNAPVDRVVSIAGVGRPADELIMDQVRPNLSDALIERCEQIIAKLKEGETASSVPLALMSLFRPSVQPYLISWFRYDPADEIAKLDMPVLVVQGNRDVQVNESEAQLLMDHAKDGRLHIIEGMNHVFKASSMDGEAQRKTYTDGSLPLVEQLPGVVGAFVLSIDQAP